MKAYLPSFPFHCESLGQVVGKLRKILKVDNSIKIINRNLLAPGGGQKHEHQQVFYADHLSFFSDSHHCPIHFPFLPNLDIMLKLRKTLNHQTFCLQHMYLIIFQATNRSNKNFGYRMPTCSMATSPGDTSPELTVTQSKERECWLILIHPCNLTTTIIS